MMTFHFEEDNLTFNSIEEVIKYKKEHPEWEGVQNVSEEPIVIKHFKFKEV